MQPQIIPKSVRIQKRPTLAVSESAVPKDVVTITKGLQLALPRLNITPNSVQRALNGEKSEVPFDKYLDIDLLQIAKQEKIPSVFFHLVLGQFKDEDRLSPTNKAHFLNAKKHLNELDGNIYAASTADENEALLDAAERVLKKKGKGGEANAAAAFANIPSKNLEYLVETLKKLDARVEVLEKDGNLVARSSRFGSRRLDDAFETLGIKCGAPWMGRTEEGDVVWKLAKGMVLTATSVSAAYKPINTKVLRFVAKRLGMRPIDIADKTFKQLNVSPKDQTVLVKKVAQEFKLALSAITFKSVKELCSAAETANKEMTTLSPLEEEVHSKFRDGIELVKAGLKAKDIYGLVRGGTLIAEAEAIAQKKNLHLSWKLVEGIKG